VAEWYDDATLAATMSEYARQFGLQVRKLRQARRMSQEDLAEAASLHRTHISLIERAHRLVQLDTLEKLAIALNVQPAELMPPITPRKSRIRH